MHIDFFNRQTALVPACLLCLGCVYVCIRSPSFSFAAGGGAERVVCGLFIRSSRSGGIVGRMASCDLLLGSRCRRPVPLSSLTRPDATQTVEDLL